jgi:RNA polymerase sigma-70 factor (ECF subfamily)
MVSQIAINTANKDDVLDMDRLLEQYGNSLLRLCFLYLKDAHLAEDAVQDTLIKAYESYVRFRGDCSEKTWLTSIAVNICKNYMRSAWWRRIDAEKALESIPATEEMDDPQDETLLLEVMKLSSKYKEVILMFYYQEMRIKEISQALNIPEGTVAVRLKRARELLKNKLKGWYYNEHDD